MCVGELVRRTGLVELIDAELTSERRAVPVKRRRRGVSAGELVVALAESQLVGGECYARAVSPEPGTRPATRPPSEDPLT